MKKLKLKELNLGELLTREQMKNVVGGDYNCYAGTCTLSIQGDDGKYETRTGSCVDATTLLQTLCYCDVGLGAVPVTSNGGTSKCTK